jgi:hypothetical protein
VRTTLTLDDDVAVLVQEEAQRSGSSFKAVVNDLLRKGLMKTNKNDRQEPFVVTPLPLGLPPGLSYDSISELLEALEGPLHK